MTKNVIATRLLFRDARLTGFASVAILLLVLAAPSRFSAQTSTVATVGLTQGWATFGEAVPQGLAQSGLQVGSLLTQTDVKNRWPDGSIRFAIVTVNAPANARYPVSAAAASSGTFTPFVPNASITLTVSGVRYTATLQSTPAPDLWLSGPLVYEGRTTIAPISAANGGAHPFLRVNFDMRVYSDGKARVDVSVENMLDQAGATTVTYDVAIEVNSQVVFTKSAVRHFYLTRWRKIFEIGSTPLAAVTPDLGPFRASRALPAYLSIVTNLVSTPTGASYDILREGALTANMPSQDGRQELAPFPDWTARYLVHKHATQRAFVLANGDLSGSWPVHVREGENNSARGVGSERLISLDQRPTLWYDARAQSGGFDYVKGTPLPLVEYRSTVPGAGQTALIPDNAHQPSLAFVPYLLTGDRYYAEEMAFWANYGMLRTYNGDGIRGAQGILASNEVQGIGWALRNLAEAAAYYPDASPVTAYLSQKVLDNLRWLDTYATVQHAGTNPNTILWTGLRPDGPQYIALWEQNDLAYALDRASTLGFAGGLVHRDAIAKFQLKLFTSDPDYPRAQAAPSVVAVGAPEGGSFTFFRTMAEIWSGTAGRTRPFAGHHGPEARLSLMIGVQRGWPGAQAAYDYLWPILGVQPTWGAVPDLGERAGWALDFYSPELSSEIGAAPAAPTVMDAVAASDAVVTAAVMLPESIPDFSADTSRPSVQSVQSGSWSSPATWQGGQIPTVNHVVRVVLGHTVTIDDTSAVAYTIAVDGKLAFALAVNTRLKVTNLEVMAGDMGAGTPGVLEVGTAATPIAAAVTAEIVIADSPLGGSVADPDQFGTGIIVFGKASMHGSVRTPTFVRLATEPRAGHTTLTLSVAVSGWQIGDRLVLPDTRHLKETDVTGSGWVNAVNQWEERTVQAISADARTLTLNSALQYDHLGARDLNNVLDFLPHVGNLTRNVIIRSENPAGTRGHTLTNHLADVDMRYVLFKDLGRTTYLPLNSTTNHIGRYPIHMHHVSGPLPTPADGYQFTLVGNAVDGGPVETKFKWGVAVHGSHYGLIQDNVVYNYNGAAVATEDGSESFNVFDHNFALRGMGEPNDAVSEARMAMGTEGVGFWFRGPNNYVRNNVAANYQNPTTEAAYGFVFQFRYLGNIAVPNFQGADTVMATGQSTTMNGNNMPLRQFDNNEAYGAMQGGFTYWWVSSLDPQPYANAQESVVQDLKIWNVYNKAVYMYPGQAVTFDGLKIRGGFNAQSRCCGNGVYAADYSSKGIIIRNSDIQGMEEGITAPEAGFGPEPNLTIQSSYLRNDNNVLVPTNGSVNGCWMADKLIVITNTRFDAPPGRSLGNIAMVRDVAYAPECLGKLDEARVYAYNGVATDNFQVYHANTAVLPRPPASCTPTTRTGINGLLCPIAPLGPVPPTATVSASPASMSPGQSATLTWSTTNASTITIDPGIGAVAGSGTRSVFPAATTIYTLTATNATGSVTAAATVTVSAPDTIPPVISGVASSTLTTSGATISFTTDEPSYHQVEYGPTTAYGTVTALDALLRTSHSQALSGLAAGNLYHYRVRASDAAGNVAMSGDFTFTTPATPPQSSLAVGTVVSADGSDTVSAGPFNMGAGDLAIAFATAAGPSAGGQSLTISGGSLTWTRVTRANGTPGVAEIWQASSPTARSSISVTSTPSVSAYTQSVTVVTFSGAAGVGVWAGVSGPNGGPSVSLTTTQPGSLLYAAGNDWDGAIARTLGANQAMVHQWMSTGSGDTYWVQRVVGAVPAAGTVVQLNDTAPTADRWNFAGVEIVAASTGKTTPSITWAAPGAIVYGTALGAVQLNATTTVPGTFVYTPASGTVPLAGAGQVLSVTFTPTDIATYNTATATVTITVSKATPAITWSAPADMIYGTPLGALQLNATANVPGTFVYTPPSGTVLAAGPAQALAVTFAPVDAANYTAATASVTVNVVGAPSTGLAVDQVVVAKGRGIRTTPLFNTSVAGELLVAFVGSDGPSAGGQTMSVSGAGLAWTMVKRVNSQAGTSEIWTARASGTLTDVTVTSTPGVGGYRQLLTLLTFTGASGTGASAAASAASGAPSVSLTTTSAGAFVYGTGNDWDRAIGRTLGPGQAMVSQWIDTNSGDTYWVQRWVGAVTAAGTVIRLNDTAPTGDRWNFAAVEIVPQ